MNDVLADANLEHCNTLRVSARARFLVDIDDTASLPTLLRDGRFAGLPVMVLGEGSNLLFTRDFDGLVLRLRNADITLIDEQDGVVAVRAGAGAQWNALVDWSLAHGLGGIENLALIPGLCGAAPIQNIGAYGVELADVLSAVEVYDRVERTQLRLPSEDCALAYRDSRFKQAAGRYIVTAIHLRLQRHPTLRLDYAGIREELDSMQVATADVLAVGEAVRRLRRRKLPQPDVLPNAGSFFKNPIVSEAQGRVLRAQYPAMPQWPAADARCKLSAAWLIEQAGYKGYRDGDAGIAERHALVLVNHGRASGAQLLALAMKVRAGVAARFGVHIEPEPVIL